MTVIELTDEEAAALNAQAKRRGLTLRQWLSQLAAQGPLPAATDEADQDDDRPIWEVIVEDMKDVSPEDLAALPKDGASQIDHYIYGLPKRKA